MYYTNFHLCISSWAFHTMSFACSTKYQELGSKYNTVVSLTLHKNSKTLAEGIYTIKLNTKVDEIACIIEIMSNVCKS